MKNQRTLFVGIGSPYGDDQLGWLVADRVAAVAADKNIEIRRAASPIDLLDWLDHIDRLVICDACRGLSSPGEMFRWTWPIAGVPALSWSGTHDLSLPAALVFAERLGRLPRQVAIWTAEAATIDTDHALSVEVTAAIPKLVDGILAELTGREPLEEITCTSIH